MPIRRPFMALGTVLSFVSLWLAVNASVLASDLQWGLYRSQDDASGTTPADSPKLIREVRTKTILVNATCGSITESVPLVVTIQ